MGVYTGEQAARQSLQKLEKAVQMRTACTDPNCSGKGEHVLCPVTKGNIKMKPYLHRGNETVRDSLSQFDCWYKKFLGTN